jgi:MFS family permease
MGRSGNEAGEWRRHWSLPIAGALGYATSVIHVYSIGAYIAPLQQQFGWSRAQISAGLTVAAFGSALFCVPLGRLVDRLGPRRIGLVGILSMCAAFAVLSTATGQWWNWVVLWSVLALGNICVQTTVWTSAVASRFVASRGLALAITLSGASLSATVFPILATLLIGTYGWRTAFVATPGIWAAIVFPIMFVCFRGAQDRGLGKRTAALMAAREVAGISIAEGLRSPVLYKLLVAGGLFAFTVVGIVVHFVPILRDSGASPLAAAGTASLIGVFSIVGRLGTGFLLDRLAAHRIGAVAFLLPMFACVLLFLDGAGSLSRAAAAVLVGLTTGSEVDVIAYLAAKHFGLKNFGSLYGALVMALAFGTAFGPLAAGAVFDHFHSYVPFLILTMIMMAVSSLALISLGDPPGKPLTAPSVP